MQDITSFVKKNLFKSGMYIGIAMLLSLGMQLIFSFVITLFLQIKGYTSAEISAIYTDTWSGYLLNSLLLSIICTVPFLILKKVNIIPIHKFCSFAFPENKKVSVLCIFFAFSGAMIANIISAVFVAFLQNSFGFEATQGIIGDDFYNSPFELIFTIICVSLFPAIFEEFAFRGMLLGTLRKFGDIPAIIVSSLLFALYHGNFIQIPFALIVGVFLGLIVVITDSIWPAIIVHFINNTYSTLVATLPENAYSLSALLFLGIIILGIISFVNLLKIGAFKSIQKRITVISTPSKILRIIFAPSIIIFIVFMIYFALMNRV